MRFGRRASNGDQKRICFVTDVHGSERCFRKFLNTAKFYDAQYLILGGDITGKTLVPIEKGPTGWRASFNDHDYRDMSDEEMREVEQRIRDGGRTRSAVSTTSCSSCSPRSAATRRSGMRSSRGSAAGWTSPTSGWPARTSSAT